MAGRSLSPVRMAVLAPHVVGQSFDPFTRNCVDLDLAAWSFEVELDSLLYTVPPRAVFGGPDDTVERMDDPIHLRIPAPGLAADSSGRRLRLSPKPDE